MADLLRDKLGIYQHRNWRQAFDEHPYALRAQMAFTLPRSASFDLIGPTRFDSDLGLHLHNWGPGPHYTRIDPSELEGCAGFALAQLSRYDAGQIRAGRTGAARGRVQDVEGRKPL